jgi:hypothetical protein
VLFPIEGKSLQRLIHCLLYAEGLSFARSIAIFLFTLKMSTSFMDDPRSRAGAFCDRFGICVPILLAPMAGACPPSSSVAVMRAGAFGACAGLLMQPKEIEDWAAEVRANVDGPFQINLWISDPPPVRGSGGALSEYEGRT